MAANAVGSADVINESLTNADVANGQLNDEDVGQGTFVNFTGSIGNVPALGCVEKPITGVNATGDHLLRRRTGTPNRPELVYSAESHISDPNVTIQVCNPTPSAIDDGNTNFNLLVIDAH